MIEIVDNCIVRAADYPVYNCLSIFCQSDGALMVEEQRTICLVCEPTAIDWPFL